MEFTKKQIAGLVLGYLKSERCFKAYDEFLAACPYIQSGVRSKIGKYLVTRVLGMCLLDFLEEYATIYSIIQARLEATNYFSETQKRATLVDQLLYLLDKDGIPSGRSTPTLPLSFTSEVETTPAYSLPGHNCAISPIQKNSKRSKSATKNLNSNKDKEDVLEVCEVLTQSLLESHELHEKIAENINLVRNTPGENTDDHISAGVSKEVDAAIIQSAVQITEEDPLYKKLIDEIIGPCDNGNKKMCIDPQPPPPTSPPPKTPPPPPLPTSPPPTTPSEAVIDAHNNDAVRSIIEAAKIPELQQNKEQSKNDNVYVFDGTLDTYLKSSVTANPINTNPLYINTGGLIAVVPPPEPSKQFYIVNNQPLINMTRGVITDNDIMAMPTIIVNDDQQFATNQTFNVNKKAPPKRGKNQKIAPKPEPQNNINEFIAITTTSETIVKDNNKCVANAINNSLELPKTNVAVTVPITTPTLVTTTTTTTTTKQIPRQASHVRNLDFSTPVKPSAKKAWDADLRSLAAKNDENKVTSPKKKRVSTGGITKPKRKIKNKKNENVVASKKPEDYKIEEAAHSTPVKDGENEIPNTPSITTGCTPFVAVLEEQLKGVDLISMPTPKISITPGFPITPGLNLNSTDLLIPYNNRSTDYSTSSSYYQPSDTEQNKSLDQLIEECRKLEDNSPKEEFANLRILSDVVVSNVAKMPIKKNEHLKKFNSNVIGKKNLNLLKGHSTSSSSDSSGEESEKSEEQSNKTIICKNNEKVDTKSISKIINTVEVKSTLEVEAGNNVKEERKNLLSRLEEVRLRTVKKIKTETQSPIKRKRGRPPVNKKVSINKTKSEIVRKTRKQNKVKNEDKEAEELVKGLAQRGIHLLPNKTPQKKLSPQPSSKLPNPPLSVDEEFVLCFDSKTFESYEIVKFDDKISNPEKTLDDYDFDVLNKSFKAELFDEHLKEDVTRTIKCTPFYSLMDIPSKINILTPRKIKRSVDDEETENELMDYIFTDNIKDTLDAKNKGVCRKRKIRCSEDENSNKQIDKKTKNALDLLKKVNVDKFLDHVHMDN